MLHCEHNNNSICARCFDSFRLDAKKQEALRTALMVNSYLEGITSMGIETIELQWENEELDERREERIMCKANHPRGSE